jgi:hypothetical protein
MHSTSRCQMWSQNSRSWRKCCCESSNPTLILSANNIFRTLQLLLVRLILEVMSLSNKPFAAAGLNLTEPSSTGIGGDMFCLFYNAKSRKVEALNGSGRAGLNCTLEQVRRDLGLRDGEEGEIPLDHVHAVTVPGAAAGWVDTVERFGSGKLSLEQILAPAIELGEKGFPVSELSSRMVRLQRANIIRSWLISLVECGGRNHCKGVSKFRRDAQGELRWHISGTKSW